MEISERYFKELLAEKYNPSKELFEKILVLAKENNWPRVKPSKPKPMRFKEELKKNIMPLNFMVKNLRVSRKTVFKELGDYIFTLYGTEYLNTKLDAVKATLKLWRNAINNSVEEEKEKAAEGPLKVKGIRLSDKERKLVEFDLRDIVAYRARRVKGRNYWTLVVRTKNRKDYEVLQKYNRSLFRSGQLPFATTLKC